MDTTFDSQSLNGNNDANTAMESVNSNEAPSTSEQNSTTNDNSQGRDSESNQDLGQPNQQQPDNQKLQPQDRNQQRLDKNPRFQQLITQKNEAQKALEIEKQAKIEAEKRIEELTRSVQPKQEQTQAQQQNQVSGRDSLSREIDQIWSNQDSPKPVFRDRAAYSDPKTGYDEFYKDLRTNVFNDLFYLAFTREQATNRQTQEQQYKENQQLFDVSKEINNPVEYVKFEKFFNDIKGKSQGGIDVYKAYAAYIRQGNQTAIPNITTQPNLNANRAIDKKGKPITLEKGKLSAPKVEDLRNKSYSDLAREGMDALVG